MARGKSGRIVLEINPSQKDELHCAVRKDGLTLKDWFLGQVTQYLRNRSHTTLGKSFSSEGPAPSSTTVAPLLKTKNNRVKAKSK